MLRILPSDEQGGSLPLMLRKCRLIPQDGSMVLVRFMFSMKESHGHSQTKEWEFFNMSASSWVLLYARTIDMLITGV